MPLAPYLYRYRPAYGGDPDPVSPIALTPPGDDVLPALDPTMRSVGADQTPNPIPPAPVSFRNSAAALKPPTNGQSGANAIPLQPLNPDGRPNGSPNYSGLKKLAVMAPPPAAMAATPVFEAPPSLDNTPPPTPAQIADANVERSVDTAPVPPEKPSETQATIDDLKQLHKNRPQAPSGNWAQRLGGALLAMTKLAPVANQIIHPKYSAEQAAYQGKEADLQQKLKELEGAEDIAGKTQQRQAKAGELAEQGESLSNPHAGKQQIPAAFGRTIPVLQPDPDGTYWIPKDSLKELLKPEGQQKPIVVGGSLWDPVTKTVLYQAPDKPDKPPKTLGDEARIAAVAAGIDPSKSPEEWTPEEASRVQKIIELHKQAERPIINNNIPMSGDAMDMAADVYLKTGNLPPMGMGSQGAVARTAVLNKAAEKLKSQGGGDVATNKAIYSGLNQSLGQLQKIYGLTSAFENNTRENMKLLDGASQATDRTGSPLVNKYLLALKSGVFGDPDTARLKDAIRTVANEVAKIRSGQQSGAATDSARAEAMESIHSAMSKGQLSAVVGQMKQEMKNRTGELKKQIGETQNSIKGIGHVAAPAPIVQHSPSTGRDRYSLDGGVTWQPGQPPVQ